MTNIHFIRAAILAATNHYLELEEVRDLLIEEGLLDKRKAKTILFRGYGEFYDYFYQQDGNVIINQKIDKTKDILEELEEDDNDIEK